jgi:hypothetical protein
MRWRSGRGLCGPGFMGHTVNFWIGAPGLSKAIVWPALLVYQAFEFCRKKHPQVAQKKLPTNHFVDSLTGTGFTGPQVNKINSVLNYPCFSAAFFSFSLA